MPSDDFMDNQKRFSCALTDDIRVLCFAQDTLGYAGMSYSDRGFSKPRMWAQYANNHKGVCLVFNKELLINKVKNQFANCFFKCENIRYDNQLQRVIDAYSLKTSELNKKSIEDVVIDKVQDYWDIYYFTKHIDWISENEFRIVLKYAQEFAYVDIDGILDAIILGTGVDLSIINSIKINLRQFKEKPEIRNLFWMHSAYTLSPNVE